MGDSTPLDRLVNGIAYALAGVGDDELRSVVQEATQCIFCALYGVSSNVKHEVKPIDGIVDLLKALNDPYVRKGLGLLVEILRSLGRCLEVAEKLKQADGSCPVSVPCHAAAFLGRLGEGGFAESSNSLGVKLT